MAEKVVLGECERCYQQKPLRPVRVNQLGNDEEGNLVAAIVTLSVCSSCFVDVSTDAEHADMRLESAREQFI